MKSTFKRKHIRHVICIISGFLNISVYTFTFVLPVHDFLGQAFRISWSSSFFSETFEEAGEKKKYLFQIISYYSKIVKTFENNLMNKFWVFFLHQPAGGMHISFFNSIFGIFQSGVSEDVQKMIYFLFWGFPRKQICGPTNTKCVV